MQWQASTAADGNIGNFMHSIQKARQPPWIYPISSRPPLPHQSCRYPGLAPEQSPLLRTRCVSVVISAACRPPASGQDAPKHDYTALFSADCATSGLGGCDSRFATRPRGVAGQVAGASDAGMLYLVNCTVNSAMTHRSDRAIWTSAILGPPKWLVWAPAIARTLPLPNTGC